jgi:anti-sigma B factor antagonist
MARRIPSPSEVLEIQVDEGAGRTVCWIRGELDSINTSRLRVVLGEHIDSDVVVDLSALEFIDSSGLGVLVGALKRFQAVGHHLTLRSPTSAIRRVFAMTGLDQAFTIED